MIRELAMQHGYKIYNDVLSSDECDHFLISLHQEGFGRGRAGTRHLMHSKIVQAISHTASLLQIARETLGAPAVPYKATFFEKTEQANWLVAWHQDTALPLASRFEESCGSAMTSGWTAWSVKDDITYAHAPGWALSRVVALRLHLDDSSADNGPLRVILGSHRLGVMQHQEALEYAASHHCTECIVPRGGVLAMSPLIIHSSSKSRNAAPRRVLHIEYADSLDLGPGIRLALA